MTSQLSSTDHPVNHSINHKPNQNLESNLGKVKQEIVLCPHCQRTASNGIKCQGICVADSSY
ncbi:hypothetical protein Syn7502_00574 [Synechococcus sp. PCC 7502]|uniref:hypothetical protein n=1 Tax=Synechococcus sp. PCC 7502 TaxID=1173263 RepID=UPI00029FB46F|nr:hypothetical protein [Synechococcus sp. PCC 7502]AFY72726.1 hypothetical protein Syn7502_00574 [Synechococcus sp. PCC 7502]